MEPFIAFAIKKWYLFAALGGILALLIGGEVLRKVRGISSVSPNQALQLMNHDDALVLDTRDIGEYRESHIPGARNTPFAGLEERLGEFEKFKGKPIIVYCRTGSRSPAACNLLKKKGFEPVYNLSGGLLAWQSASLPVKKKK